MQSRSPKNYYYTQWSNNFLQPLLLSTTWKRDLQIYLISFLKQISVELVKIFLGGKLVFIHERLHLKYQIRSKSYVTIKQDLSLSKSNETTTQKQIKTIIVKKTLTIEDRNDTHNWRSLTTTKIKVLLEKERKKVVNKKVRTIENEPFQPSTILNYWRKS